MQAGTHVKHDFVLPACVYGHQEQAIAQCLVHADDHVKHDEVVLEAAE